MKLPRSVNKSFIDRLEVHFNTIVKKKAYITLTHTHYYNKICYTVTPIKIKFISYRNSTKYTNNIHQNIQYIHSDTLLLSNAINRFCVIIWGSSSTYIQ